MEFKVNDYITLKLNQGKTDIYINGENFKQCKRLVINIPLDDIKEYDSISSIDEAAIFNATIYKGKGKESSVQHIQISPETEFWAHCSNLQAWAENNYDTRLLHSNLVFHLLKKLAESLEKMIFF